jgi:WD40 repeat protein
MANQSLGRFRRQIARGVAGAAVSVASWGVAAFAVPTIQAVRVLECAPDGDERASVVTGVAMSADGQTIAAASDDHAVRIWDGQTLASGANDRSVCLWNVSTGARLFELPTLDSAVASVSFHPNGQQLAIAGFGDRLAIINTSTGQMTQQLDCPSADLRAVAFSPDGQRMAVAGRSGQIRLWNLTTGALERDISTNRQRIRALAFSPDGARLASAGEDITIHVVDLTSGGQDVSLPARPAKVFAAVFLNGQTLATGGSDNRIRIWDLASRVVTKELAGHTGSVAAMASDGTGTALVSGGYDTTLRVWDLNESPSPSVARSSGDAVR